MAKIPMVYWSSGDDLTPRDGVVWWQLGDGWIFHVELTPWPARAGESILRFRYGPDEAHLRYDLRTERPLLERIEKPIDSVMPEPEISVIDHTPWDWKRYEAD